MLVQVSEVESLTARAIDKGDQNDAASSSTINLGFDYTIINSSTVGNVTSMTFVGTGTVVITLGVGTIGLVMEQDSS